MTRRVMVTDSVPPGTHRWCGHIPRSRFRGFAAGVALAWALAGSLLAGCGTAHGTIPPHTTRAASPATSPAASSSPTSAATATATATDIPLIVLTGATLGGATAGFTAAYGAPSGSGQWDARGASIAVTLTAGTDGQPHVVGLVAHPSGGGTWTASQARQACAAFLPPDAAHQRDTTTTSGDQEAIYLSDQLGSTFLPSEFGDAPPGTLAIVYAPSTAGSVAQCNVVTGTL